jgi:hypothetical protein
MVERRVTEKRRDGAVNDSSAHGVIHISTKQSLRRCHSTHLSLLQERSVHKVCRNLRQLVFARELLFRRVQLTAEDVFPIMSSARSEGCWPVMLATPLHHHSPASRPARSASTYRAKPHIQDIVVNRPFFSPSRSRTHQPRHRPRQSQTAALTGPHLTHNPSTTNHCVCLSPSPSPALHKHDHPEHHIMEIPSTATPAYPSLSIQPLRPLQRDAGTSAALLSSPLLPLRDTYEH